jgi:large subunit ribosomal protein L22
LLKNSPGQASPKLRKLLLSAIANWQTKNEGVRIEDSDLFIKEIQVDSGRMLKRIHTAPQGRAHRIRKRSNHVTLIIDDRNRPEVEEEVEEVEETEEENTEETAE